MLGFKSRRPYYARKAKAYSQTFVKEKVLQLVKDIRLLQPRIGSKKLYLDIKQNLDNLGIKMGRDKLHELLKEENLTIKPKKKFKHTTNSKHWFYKYKNMIKHLDINRPEQVFVNDITYVKVNNKWAYLFLTTDAYSKKIMGWNIDFSMKVDDGIKAIKMADKNRTYSGNVFHHSDRGIQYCSPRYIQYIQKKNFIPSMTEDLHVYENAIAERINGILKQEFNIDCGFHSLSEARKAIKHAIFIYNNIRRHNSLHNLTPNFVHLNPGIKIKTWGKQSKIS